MTTTHSFLSTSFLYGGGVSSRPAAGQGEARQIREHPIIFTTELIPKILDGTKTQTRRPIKPQPIYQKGQPYSQWVWNKKSITIPKGIREGIDYALWWDRVKNPESIIRFCPYGQIGDRLWVRETFDIGRDNKVFYKADYNETMPRDMFGWKPSIHMPRWASRITLEITEIRVERLQEIMEEDALAEGITVLQGTWQRFDPETLKMIGEPQPYTARYHFEALWDSLNPKYPWESNPWVWVIEWPSYKEAHE